LAGRHLEVKRGGVPAIKGILAAERGTPAGVRV
jgi:hypothetical protein